MFKTEKAKLIALGVFILILTVIAILIYRAGKKKGGINLSNPINDNPGDVNNQGAQSSSSEIKQLATDCHYDMDGVNLSVDETVWSRVLALSDTDFIKLNNQFNVLYQKESGQSFAKWIDNESAVNPLGDWHSIKPALQKRLTKLNLM